MLLYCLCVLCPVLLVSYTENYNWCIVPDSAYDAVLFAGVALLVACVVSGRLSAVWVLVAGASWGVIAVRSLGCLSLSV